MVNRHRNLAAWRRRDHHDPEVPCRDVVVNTFDFERPRTHALQREPPDTRPCPGPDARRAAFPKLPVIAAEGPATMPSRSSRAQDRHRVDKGCTLDVADGMVQLDGGCQRKRVDGCGGVEHRGREIKEPSHRPPFPGQHPLPIRTDRGERVVQHFVRGQRVNVVLGRPVGLVLRNIWPLLANLAW